MFSTTPWVLALLALGGWSSADPEAAVFEWEAPSSCPDVDAVRRAVLERLPDGGVPSLAGVSVHGQIERVSDEFVLTLEIVGTTTLERTIRDRHCAPMGDAAALIIAIAVQRELASEVTTEPTESAPTVPVIAEPTPTESTTPDPEAPAPTEKPPPAPPREEPIEPAPSRAVVFGIRAAAGIGLGALPSAALDLEIAPGLSWGSLRLEIVGRGQLPRPARFTDEPAQGADIGRWSITPRACWVPAATTWRFPLCGGVELGGMVGVGVGLPTNERAHLPWVAGAIGGGVERSLWPWLAVVASAEAGLPLIRPIFVGRTRGPVHQAGIVSGIFTAGLRVRFE